MGRIVGNLKQNQEINKQNQVEMLHISNINSQSKQHNQEDK
jgi:hypothetical protein